MAVQEDKRVHLNTNRGEMEFSAVELLELAALFFFTMASAGFVLFVVKYPRNSKVRLWGIRACHLSGFIGVLFHRLYHGYFTEPGLLIVSSLVVSMFIFEVTARLFKWS